MANTSAIFKGAYTKLLTAFGLSLETGQHIKFVDGAALYAVLVSDAAGVVTLQSLPAAAVPSLDASKITSGVLDIARIPPAALERLVVVADQPARFALTTATVQLGDTVLQTDTNILYMVSDEANLGNAGGYQAYVAATAADVPNSVVLAKVLTGMVLADGAPVATDTILAAFGKLSRVALTDASNQALAAGFNATSVVGAANELRAIHTDQKEPTGWVDQDNIGVAYDPTGRTITLTHSSGFVVGYYRGKKFSLTSPWTSTDHGLTNGTYWMTISAAGAADWGTINTFPGFDQVLVANVNYGATNKFAFRECHGCAMDWATHEELHRTVGAYRVSDCKVTAGTFALNTNTVAAVTPGVDAGVMADEDLKTAIAALTNGSTYTRVHIDTLNPVFTTGSTFPFPDDGTDIQYNQNPTSGTALTSMTNSNRWVNIYGLLAPMTSSAGSQAYRILWLTGQQIYTTLAAAQSEDFRTLVLGNLATVMPELVPYIRLSYKRTGSNLTRNAQFDANPTYLLGTNLALVSVSGIVPTDHAGLTGLTVADSHPASAISVVTTGFDQNLSSVENTTQLAFEKIDNLTLNGQETNYITNQSAKNVITGWFAIGADLTVARSTTASELPRENTTLTGIKIVAPSGTQSAADYVYYDFTLDDVDLNGRIMKIKWDQKVLAAYVAGALEVVITTQADRATAVATPFTAAIPAQDGTFQTYFLAPSTATCSLVIRATANMGDADGICISDVVVGPNVQVQGSAIGNWEAWTPTGSWTTNTTYTGFRRAVGGNEEYTVKVALAGAPTATALTINLPSGRTIDTTKMPSDLNQSLGTLLILDNGVGVYAGDVLYSSAGVVALRFRDDAAAAVSCTAAITEALPITFANGDYLILRFSVPVNELSSNVTLANRALETFSADDGSADVFGPNGALVPNQAVGTAVTRAFALPSTAQQTDFTVLEYRINGNWQAAADIFPYTQQGAKSYGLRGYWSSSTEYTVVFGSGGAQANNTTYAADGTSSWADLYALGQRFRLRKTSGGASVGYPISSANIVGRVDGNSPGAGIVGQIFSYTQVNGAINTSALTTITSVTDIPAGVWMVHPAAEHTSTAGASNVAYSLVGCNIAGNVIGRDAGTFYIAAGLTYFVTYPSVHLVVTPAQVAAGTNKVELQLRAFAAGLTTFGTLQVVRIA